MTASPISANDHRRRGGDLGEEMLTLKEACGILRVPEGTLRYWRYLGTGPRSFKVGRHVRYWRTDLVVWLTEQTEPQQRP